MTEYTKEWLEKNALFGCQQDQCAEEESNHADMFRVFCGKPICEFCYERPDDHPDTSERGRLGPIAWIDLPTFNPFTSIKETVDE